MKISPDGVLYLLEGENNVLRAYDIRKDTIRTVAGVGPTRHKYEGDGGPATQAPLWQPHGVCVSNDGSLILSDTINHRVRKLIPIRLAQVEYQPPASAKLHRLDLLVLLEEPLKDSKVRFLKVNLLAQFQFLQFVPQVSDSTIFGNALLQLCNLVFASLRMLLLPLDLILFLGLAQ